MEIDLIQVGAHVGKDHVRELFDSGRARSGLIIEPLPHLFRKLKRNYRDMPGAILVNAAIASEPGTQTMYYADPKPGDPDWTDQLGSFSREQVEKHANMMSGGAIDIREKSVKCLDWKTLLRKIRCQAVQKTVHRRRGVRLVSCHLVSVQPVPTALDHVRTFSPQSGPARLHHGQAPGERLFRRDAGRNELYRDPGLTGALKMHCVAAPGSRA